MKLNRSTKWRIELLSRVLLTTFVLSLSSIAPMTSYAAAPTGTMTSSEVTVTMSVLSGINAIVITSGGTEITAVNDIRIKIPSSVNAEWVTSSTELTIVNPATGVVSGTVSYPDAKTMLLDVTTNFASGESVQITSGASFTPIYGASAAAPLQ